MNEAHKKQAGKNEDGKHIEDKYAKYAVFFVLRFLYILTLLGFFTPFSKHLSTHLSHVDLSHIFQPLKYMLIPKIPNKLPETVRKQMTQY